MVNIVKFEVNYRLSERSAYLTFQHAEVSLSPRTCLFILKKFLLRPCEDVASYSYKVPTLTLLWLCLSSFQGPWNRENSSVILIFPSLQHGYFQAKIQGVFSWIPFLPLESVRLWFLGLALSAVIRVPTSVMRKCDFVRIANVALNLTDKKYGRMIEVTPISCTVVKWTDFYAKALK